MSILLAVATTVAATPLPTLTPSPSASPVVQAVVAVAPVAHASFGSLLSDMLDKAVSSVSGADITVFAALVSNGLQALIKRFRNLEWLNWVLSFALPFVLVGVAALVTSASTLLYGPVVYLLAQAAYAVGKAVLANASKSIEAPAETVTQF